MNWKKIAVIGAAAGAGFALIFALIFLGSNRAPVLANPPKTWDANALKATYVGAQLREIDRASAGLLLYYNLENGTGSDYRLGDGTGLVIMSKLRSDGSLSAEERVRLSYSTFLPARQRTRIALEIVHPFDWPSDNDPARQEKLRDFVNQRLAGVDEFVLFDETNRCQIEFPKGWQDLPLVSAAKK